MFFWHASSQARTGEKTSRHLLSEVEGEKNVADCLVVCLQYRKEHQAVIDAMTRGATTFECVEAIESVPRDE